MYLTARDEEKGLETVAALEEVLWGDKDSSPAGGGGGGGGCECKRNKMDEENIT